MKNFKEILEKKGINYTEENDNLSVGGSLDLEGTQITSLPDNLSVGGSLYLRGTQITSLPDNLSVGGSLDLRGTQITSLPDNLSENVSIRIENVGKWTVYVFKKEIKIGCEKHGVTFWKDFFKNKKSFETNPESPDYELIKKDFETALETQNKLFKKI